MKEVSLLYLTNQMLPNFPMVTKTYVLDDILVRNNQPERLVIVRAIEDQFWALLSRVNIN